MKHPSTRLRRGSHHNAPIFGKPFCVHRFETRSFPNSLAAYSRGFAFYVADPFSSIRNLRAVSHHELRRTTKHRDLVLERPNHTPDPHGEVFSISLSICCACTS